MYLVSISLPPPSVDIYGHTCKVDLGRYSKALLPIMVYSTKSIEKHISKCLKETELLNDVSKPCIHTFNIA